LLQAGCKLTEMGKANIGANIAAAVFSFVATDLDDFIVLLVLFARARAKLNMTVDRLCIGN